MKCSISVLSKKSSTHPRVGAPPATLSARAKTAIVTALGWLLAWRPSLAIRLGKLVLRVWPNFRRS
jgi:hypothetical protein